jgi:hypothetical protein
VKRVTDKKAREVPVSKLLAMAANSTLVVTTKGRPAWAIVPIPAGEDMEDFATANSPEFRRIIERSRREYKQRGGISHEELKRRFGIK